MKQTCGGGEGEAPNILLQKRKKEKKKKKFQNVQGQFTVNILSIISHYNVNKIITVPLTHLISNLQEKKY